MERKVVVSPASASKICEFSNTYLTFDIDWAEDKMMEPILEELLKRRMKSTWFVTHDTPLLQVFRKHSDLVDLGIHPNFLGGLPMERQRKRSSSTCWP